MYFTMMGKVYVASSLHNAQRVRRIQNRFAMEEVFTTYDWTSHSQVFEPADLARYGELEEKGVVDCDVFFMIHPARNGAHCELGMARVLGKHIVILEDVPVEELKTFYFRPDGHHRPIHRFQNEDAAVEFALSILTKDRK